MQRGIGKKSEYKNSNGCRKKKIKPQKGQRQVKGNKSQQNKEKTCRKMNNIPKHNYN